MEKFIFIVMFMFSISSIASESINSNEVKLKDTVDTFFLMELLNKNSKSFSRDRCDDDARVSCSEVMCEHLPAYKCDDMNDMRNIAKLCSSVRSGRCIQSMCKYLPGYKCDDMNDMSNVSKLCSQMPGRAIEAICSYLPAYKCDDMNDMNNIVKLAKGMGRQVFKCLKFTCEKLPSYKCDDLNDMKNVLNACSGN